MTFPDVEPGAFTLSHLCLSVENIGPMVLCIVVVRWATVVVKHDQ